MCSVFIFEHYCCCRCRDNSIADALLFDEGMTVQTGIQQTGIRHGIKINTRSRYVRNGGSICTLEIRIYYPNET